MAIELGLVDRAGANAQSLKNMVGVAGLEPTTPCPPDRCATGLRYTPTPRGPGALSRRARPAQALSDGSAALALSGPAGYG